MANKKKGAKEQSGIVSVFAAVLISQAANAEPPPECSIVAENRVTCRLTVDRQGQLTRLPARVEAKAPGHAVQVAVPRGPFEQIKFDETHTQVAEPDVLAALLKSLADPLKSLSFKVADNYGLHEANNRQQLAYMRSRIGAPAIAPPGLQKWGDLRERIRVIHDQQDEALMRLKSWKASAREVAKAAGELGKLPWDNWQESSVRNEISRLSAQIGSGPPDDGPLSRPDACGAGPSPELGYCFFPSGQLQIIDEQLRHAREIWVVEPYDTTPAYQQLTEELRNVTADELYLQAQLADVQSTQADLRALGKVLKDASADLSATVVKPVKSPSGSAKSEMKITAVNQLTKASITLPTATILWERHQPWELSVGLWVSALEKRSFATVPIIANGQQEVVNDVAQTIVRESTSEPTVVPGVLVHYRFTEDEQWGRRSAFLATFGIGVNSGNAEFAAGPSWAFGSLTISLLAHVGRDVRLKNGITVGQRNAPDIANSQEQHWVVRPAIGFSYRIPIL